MAVTTQLSSIFSAFNRLYTLDGPGPLSSLQIERWTGSEVLSGNYRWDVHALGTDPGLDLDAMLGQHVSIKTALADGSTATRSGLVAEAECVSYDGTVARYFVQLVPWLAALAHGRDQRTFANQTVAEVLGVVFGDYADIGRWRFTVDANRRIETLGPCDYRVQYRTHTHLDFVRHVLAEAGLGFCFVEDEDAPAGHTLVIFDDSTQLPEDETSARLGGIPQRLSGMETEAGDAILGMGQSLSLTSDRLTLISSDYRSNQSMTAAASLGNPAGYRELYDDVGPEAFSTLRSAEDTARRHADAIVSSSRFWVGTSTLHTARVGRMFRIGNAPWQGSGGGQTPDDFLITEVRHIGINNLPQTVMAALEQSLGALPQTDADTGLDRQAKAGGYANSFKAVPRQQTWRPTLEDGTGQRLNPVPTALGAQTAIVAGARGESQPGAAGPVHTDAQGRLNVRYHWQADGDKGTYPTRAMQRLASDGHGLQQTSRIGHEVLVQFANGLIHRPLVMGGLFNGQGEGGESPTPGGDSAQPLDEAVYTQAVDHAASAQGNVAGGYSPPWHGAGGGAQRHNHAGALTGFKSQGFDGQGANQLATDDCDGMGRLQMATTHAATQLNLGHLRHQADNYLGSFRGQGVELRSDSYGAVRATRGVLISSYAQTSPAQPAGDASALQSLLAQQAMLTKQFDKAAETHLTLPLAAQRGVQQPGQSSLNAQAAPVDALSKSFATTVGTDGFDQAATDAPGRSADKALPHTGDAVLGIAAQGGHGLLAGQALQYAAGETLTIGSGDDTSVAVSQALRIHSGQGISWLAGASEADGVGLSVISGKNDLQLQAQGGPMALRSKGDLTVASAKTNVELSAGQTLRLAVSGGASLLIEGGNVTFACPGNLTIHAAQHQFLGPTDLAKAKGSWGDLGLFNEYYWLRDTQTGGTLRNLPYRMVGEGGDKIEARSNAGDGRTATYSTQDAAKPVRVEYTGNEDTDHGWS